MRFYAIFQCFKPKPILTWFAVAFVGISKHFLYKMYQAKRVWWWYEWKGSFRNAIYGENSIKPHCIQNTNALKILEFFTWKNWTDTCNSGYITMWYNVHTHTHIHFPNEAYVCMPLYALNQSSFRKVFRLKKYVNCIWTKVAEKRSLNCIYQ